MMKRLCLYMIICFFFLSCVACGESEDRIEKVEAKSRIEEKVTERPTTEVKQEEEKLIKLPDVSETDFDSAKSVLISKGFLITVEEEYSDSVKAGDVIGTKPEGGVSLEENSKIVLLKSKGPRRINAKDSTISWISIDSKASDKWEFMTPFIEDGILYIFCEPVFGIDFSFKGAGFGEASITDTFDKKVPIMVLDWSRKALSENKKVSKGKKEQFFLSIPLTQLDSNRPSHVACRIIIVVGGKEQAIDVSFSISW